MLPNGPTFFLALCTYTRFERDHAAYKSRDPNRRIVVVGNVPPGVLGVTTQRKGPEVDVEQLLRNVFCNRRVPLFERNFHKP